MDTASGADSAMKALRGKVIEGQQLSIIKMISTEVRTITQSPLGL